ncbi:hypothetical protein B0T18DRAFT_302354, partial [Schizothecium vesticola]
LLLLITQANLASAATFDVNQWLKDPGYENGGTIQEQIRCYALPFGAIGFASHILTYLTVLCLALGRSPWRPWRELEGRKLNLAFGILGLTITVPLTILVMVRCRNSRSFILIAIWKLILSATMSFMTIHAARIIVAMVKIAKPYSPMGGIRFRKIMWWSILYFIGALIGLVGVANLVRLNFADIWQLRTITYVFVGVLVGMPLLAMILYFCGARETNGFVGVLSGIGWTVFVTFVLLTFLIALYTDWVLAALAGDWVGVPSSDNAAFYWTYFAAKRLSILS